MTLVPRILTGVLLAAAAVCSHAALVYSSASAFLNNVQPGAYTETFTGVADANTNTQSFSGGYGNGYSFTASVASGQQFYFGADSLSTNDPNTAITLTFTGNTVTAIGGNFFNINQSDAFTAAVVSILLSDGTSAVFNSSTFANSYVGFTSHSAISSITFQGGSGAGLFATIDNLTIGASVPEPASLALVAVAFAGLAGSRRRKAA